MTRQSGSVKRLKGIVAPLAAFAAAHPPGGSSRRRVGTNLPAPLRLAALRGEAVLRLRFFGAFGRGLPHDPTPEQWLDYWQRFVLDRGAIADLVRRAGLHRAAGLDAAPDAGDDETCFVLYCALLDSLAAKANEPLLQVAVEKFFLHLWRQQFPDIPVERSRTADPALLRARLEAALRGRWQPVEVKESFIQEATKVEFRLLALRPGQPPEELVCLERPRLKPARLAAYEAALEKMA